MDLADQYLDTIWEPPQSVAHHKKEGKGASNQLTIAADPTLDPCLRELLRRSDYWLNVYMSYVIFGPKAGSSAGGTLVDINSWRL